MAITPIDMIGVIVAVNALLGVRCKCNLQRFDLTGLLVCKVSLISGNRQYASLSAFRDWLQKIRNDLTLCQDWRSTCKCHEWLFQDRLRLWIL